MNRIHIAQPLVCTCIPVVVLVARQYEFPYYPKMLLLGNTNMAPVPVLPQNYGFILVFHIPYSPRQHDRGGSLIPRIHIPHPIFKSVLRAYHILQQHDRGGCLVPRIHIPYSILPAEAPLRAGRVALASAAGAFCLALLSRCSRELERACAAALVGVRDLPLGCISDNPVSNLRRCGGGGSAATAAAPPQHPPARGLAALLLKVRAPPQTRVPHAHAHALTLTHSLTYLLTPHPPTHAHACARDASACSCTARLGPARLGSGLSARLGPSVRLGPAALAIGPKGVQGGELEVPPRAPPTGEETRGGRLCPWDRPRHAARGREEVGAALSRSPPGHAR